MVLVHGTVGNAYDSWSGLGPVLKSYGYCVFALNYGAPQGSLLNGRGDIPTSAGQIGTFVDQVRSATGAFVCASTGNEKIRRTAVRRICFISLFLKKQGGERKAEKGSFYSFSDTSVALPP